MLRVWQLSIVQTGNTPPLRTRPLDEYVLSSSPEVQAPSHTVLPLSPKHEVDTVAKPYTAGSALELARHFRRASTPVDSSDAASTRRQADKYPDWSDLSSGIRAGATPLLEIDFLRRI